MEQNHQDSFTLGEMDQNVIHGSELAVLNNMNREPNALKVSTSPDIMETLAQKPTEVTYAPGKQENQIGTGEENHGENAHNHLVIYDPVVASSTTPVAAEVKPLRARKMPLPNYASRDFPAGGAFVVQCDKCFKWRYIHMKEEYYDSPSRMKLRSKIEVEKYLEQHPEYVAQGAKLDMLSFKTPEPLQNEYVKKHIPTSSDIINRVYDVNPTSWARPNGNKGLHS